jgi:hypothetical protein
VKKNIRHISEVSSWGDKEIIRNGTILRGKSKVPKGTKGLKIQSDDISFIQPGTYVEFKHPQIKGTHLVENIFHVTDGTQVFYIWSKKYQKTGATDVYGEDVDERSGTYEAVPKPKSAKAPGQSGIKYTAVAPQQAPKPYETTPQQVIQSPDKSNPIKATGKKIAQYIKYGIGAAILLVLVLVMKLKN